MANGPQEINIIKMGKVALELIGQAGLGYSFGTLEGRNDRFYQAVEKFLYAQYRDYSTDLT